jgi:hypothetical protein
MHAVVTFFMCFICSLMHDIIYCGHIFFASFIATAGNFVCALFFIFKKNPNIILDTIADKKLFFKQLEK